MYLRLCCPCDINKASWLTLPNLTSDSSCWALQPAGLMQQRVARLWLCLENSVDGTNWTIIYLFIYLLDHTYLSHFSLSGETVSDVPGVFICEECSCPALMGSRVLRVEQGAVIAEPPSAPIKAPTDEHLLFKSGTWLKAHTQGSSSLCSCQTSIWCFILTLWSLCPVLQVQERRCRYIAGCVLSEGTLPDVDHMRRFEALGFKVFRFPKITHALSTSLPSSRCASSSLGPSRVYSELDAYIQVSHSLSDCFTPGSDAAP